MTTKIQSILESLRGDDFPYPVAIYPDRDFDLGAILSAHALNVPLAQVVDVCDHLSDLLWPVELMWPIDVEPTVLASACDLEESTAKRSALPEETVWYLPRRTHAQTR